MYTPRTILLIIIVVILILLLVGYLPSGEYSAR